MGPLAVLIAAAAFAALLALGYKSGRIVGKYAESKGFNYRTWFWLGVFLTLPAFLILVLQPDEQERARRTQARADRLSGPRQPKRKLDPDCGERVLYVANVCKHCGLRFAEPAAS